MPATIRPTRLEVSDRFPMLGFSIRSDGAATRSELALAADPALFDAQNKAQRTPSNFYCNRSTGGLALARGETMYIVPPEVLARFVGNEKMYFGLATSTDASTPMRVDVRPGKDSPYISLRGLSSRSMTRVRILPNRQQRAAGYNGAGMSSLEWAGDAATPGMVASPVAAAPTSAPQQPQAYDDGFGPMPAATAPVAQEARAGAMGGGMYYTPERQNAAQAMQAGERSIEVKYRMFIPSPLIDAPTAVFGGDGRSFSYAGGTSRGEITSRVRIAANGTIAGVDLVRRSWGESTEYNTGDTHTVAGKPSWWRDRNAGAQPTRRATLAASDDNLRIYAGAPGSTRPITANLENAAMVTIDAVGQLPLSMVAPAIDADITLFIRMNGSNVEVRVDGSHDGFPCHELYVNGQRIYSYDPVAAGSSPEALMPPMDVTAHTSWVTVPNATAQGMSGAAGAATAIGGFVLQTVRDSVGDVTWELDQFAHIKHPNDTAPASPAAFRDAPTIRLDTWPISGGLVDDISAWFSIDWQFNGRSLGNVRISNIGTNDAVGWSLHVRAQIMDDNILYAPAQAAALRIRLHYRFSRGIGSDVIAVADVHLLGDGTVRQSHQFLQSSALDAAPEEIRMPAPPPPRARAMDGGASAAIAIGGFILSSIRDSAGDVTWELDQFAHIKHPNDVAPATAVPFRDAATIRLNTWPVSGGLVDDISAWFSIDWQFNGRSLGNIRISNIGTNDAVGWGLSVRAQIMDDNILYNPNQCAALRIRLHYRFSRSIGSDVLAVTDIHLYGNGSWEQTGRWIQSSALAMSGAPSEEIQMPAPPPPRARAMDGGASAAIAIGGFIVESIRDSAGDVTWELDQFAHRKHPNDAVPATAVAYRDANTIRLNRWPVSGGLVDDISAWFSIDWQFNGRSLGNVRISNIGTNDAVGWALHVRAQIMDDNILYEPNQCAALRLRFHYRFSRSIGSDVIGVTDVHLYGNGSYEQNSQWLQSSALGLDAATPATPRTTGSNGSVAWDLMQYPEFHPASTEAVPSARIPGEAISLADWPYLEETDGTRTQLALDVAWAYDATGSVGGVRIIPGRSTSGTGRTLTVSSVVAPGEGTPGNALLVATIRYAFAKAGERDQVAVTTIRFYGAGKFVRDSEWEAADSLLSA